MVKPKTFAPIANHFRIEPTRERRTHFKIIRHLNAILPRLKQRPRWTFDPVKQRAYGLTFGPDFTPRRIDYDARRRQSPPPSPPPPPPLPVLPVLRRCCFEHAPAPDSF